MLSRRKLLFSGATLSGLGFLSSSWIGSVLAQQVRGVTTDDAAQLHQLSLFLTERDALFLATTGVIPASGTINPTLTGVALSIRLADIIARKV